MEQEIIDGEVVTTTKMDLATFIQSRKLELDECQRNIASLTDNANAIVAELEALIVTEE